jgi:hypothetical protein
MVSLVYASAKSLRYTSTLPPAYLRRKHAARVADKREGESQPPHRAARARTRVFPAASEKGDSDRHSDASLGRGGLGCVVADKQRARHAALALQRRRKHRRVKRQLRSKRDRVVSEVRETIASKSASEASQRNKHTHTQVSGL